MSSELEKYQKKKKLDSIESKVQLRIELEGQSIFKDEEQRRHRMSSGSRVIVILSIILVVVALVSITLVPFGIIQTNLEGTSFWTGLHLEYSFATYRDVVVTRVSQLVEFITSGESETVQYIIYTHLVVIMAGMAMSACGAAYQGVFQNPMASATTMGVQSGGTIAGILYIYFVGENSLSYILQENYASSSTDTTIIISGSELIDVVSGMTVWELVGQQLCTLAGCFLGVALIVGIAFAVGRGKVNTVALMLAGSVFSTVINQITQLFQYAASQDEDGDTKLTLISNLMTGRFTANGYSWYHVVFMSIPLLICIVILLCLSNKINIMVFGEEEAKSMGVSITGFRNLLIAVCTVITAVILSFCGTISMIDFMMPHFARYLVGPDFKVLVPTSILLGGITTVLVYDVCYMMGSTSRFNMYVGVVCGIMSVFFVLLFRRQRHADWA